MIKFAIAFILFFVEIFAFSAYCAYDITESKKEIRSSKDFSIQMEEVSYEKGTNEAGEEGYYFTFIVANNAAYVQTEEIKCYTNRGVSVEMSPVSVYQSIGEDNGWYYQIVKNREVPPGTKVTLMYFITQETLDEIDGNKLIFDNTLGVNSMSVFIRELE